MSTDSAIVNTTSSLISPQIPSQRMTQGVPLKLGIMASGSGSNFEAVAQAIQKGQLNAQIQVLIYNNPDAYAAVRAASWGVPAVLLNHRDTKNREEFDASIVKPYESMMLIG